MYEHITLFPHFNQLQSTYRPLHSTETVLLCTIDNIYHLSDQGNRTVLAFIDLSSTFDMVDHNILLARLYQFWYIWCCFFLATLIPDMPFSVCPSWAVFIHIQTLQLCLKPGFHYPSWRPELTAQVDGLPVSITRQHSVDGRVFPLAELTGRVDGLDLTAEGSVRQSRMTLPGWLLLPSYIHIGYVNFFVHSSTNIQKLCLQNTAARIVLPHLSQLPTTSLLCELHWLPVHSRITYKLPVVLVCLTYSALTTSYPSYLHTLIHYYTPAALYVQLTNFSLLVHGSPVNLAKDPYLAQQSGMVCLLT